jgi:hypothetical protein
MTEVVLTGGSGKLGRVCLSDLIEHGYGVTNVDLVGLPDDPFPFVRAGAQLAIGQMIRWTLSGRVLAPTGPGRWEAGARNGADARGRRPPRGPR